MSCSRRFGFAFFIVFALGWSGAAQATTFTLPNISAPGAYTFGNDKGLGPFTDHVYFTIEPGTSLVFSAKATNETWRHGGIYDMDGTLTGASGILDEADAALVTLNPPYPDRVVSFHSLLLGPGTYHLDIFGNSESDVGVSNDYSGTITFAATPLPGALVLMLTALGGFGVLGLCGRVPA